MKTIEIKDIVSSYVNGKRVFENLNIIGTSDTKKLGLNNAKFLDCALNCKGISGINIEFENCSITLKDVIFASPTFKNCSVYSIKKSMLQNGIFEECDICKSIKDCNLHGSKFLNCDVSLDSFGNCEVKKVVIENNKAYPVG